jgi:kynurenine formamidase
MRGGCRAAHQVPLPTYADLLKRGDAPPGSSWGIFGGGDMRGTANFLSDPLRTKAAGHIRSGSSFPLQWPLDQPQPPIGHRGNPAHEFFRVGFQHRGHTPGGDDDPSNPRHIARDDVVRNLWLQGSSQWDGLAHIRHPVYGNYNGIADQAIGPPCFQLGVDQWARTGLIGRCVLADIERYFRDVDRHWDPFDAVEITVGIIEAVLAAQASELRCGDILLLRTGWMGQYMSAALDDRKPELTSVGLEGSEDMAAFLWDHHISAVAADNAAVECYPPRDPGVHLPLHQLLIPLLGMPIGEFWYLDALAADCAADSRYEAFFVSVPLNLRGGIGSPPQAVAIK